MKYSKNKINFLKISYDKNTWIYKPNDITVFKLIDQIYILKFNKASQKRIN